MRFKPAVFFQQQTSSGAHPHPFTKRLMHGVLGLAVLAGTGLPNAVMADEAAPTAPVTDATQAAAQLRAEARLAAERGDFAGAAKHLASAARQVRDVDTARRIEQAAADLQAGGGNQFANFGPLMQLIEEQTQPPAIWDDGTGDEGGRMSQFAQGVFVGSPVMAALSALPYSNASIRNAAILANSRNNNTDATVASELRLVSLPRLEQHVAALQAAGKPIPSEVLSLAGITEVRYLFLVPETGDVVIGGPAGAWRQDENRTVNAENGRPTLQLDDLVTLSRAFSDGGPGFFMCSIDPKPEQVQAVKKFVTDNQKQLNASTVRDFTQTLEKTLGLQNVIVNGVPANSRVASVIVDADYRMKEIGIGRRDGAEGMKSYFDLVSRQERRAGASMDALRWWMTVGYETIEQSDDGLTFRLTGRTVKCLSENQMINANGTRQSTGAADTANAKFAELFTQHLPALAQQDVLFADLQNVFDLAAVAALMQTQHAAERTGWTAQTFSRSGDYAPAAVDVPAQLMTAANYRSWRGGDLMIQVAGGVRCDVGAVTRDSSNYSISSDLHEDARDASP
ncbi:MAG: DUF1598 domain-containing protein, partial [Planctomycetaceae bacterium]|nr:DUF1598 domain-containing protein [Planctomycetaceae bacterium]